MYRLCKAHILWVHLSSFEKANSCTTWTPICRVPSHPSSANSCSYHPEATATRLFLSQARFVSSELCSNRIQQNMARGWRLLLWSVMSARVIQVEGIPLPGPIVRAFLLLLLLGVAAFPQHLYHHLASWGFKIPWKTWKEGRGYLSVKYAW